MSEEEQQEALNHEVADLIQRAIRIKPMNGNLGDILKAAHADKHDMLKPTDVIWKNGEIVGGIEMASIPLVLLWMHTKKTNARDSIAVVNYFENVMEKSGQQSFILPVAVNSPYMSYATRLGYKNLGNFNLFLKA